MSMWLMYLVLKLDGITKALQVLTVIALIVIGVMTFIFIVTTFYHKSENYTEYDKAARKNFLTNVYPGVKKFLIRIWIAIAICGMISILTPTTKQAAAIYFVPKVIANKQVRKMPDKLVTLANGWMDEQIKSIKEETK